MKLSKGKIAFEERSMCCATACTVEVHNADAERLGLKNGDWAELYSPYGCIRMRVKTTARAKPGVLMAIHGYTEANVNELIGRNHVDPYSGFPGFKGMRCNIRKVQEGL